MLGKKDKTDKTDAPPDKAAAKAEKKAARAAKKEAAKQAKQEKKQSGKVSSSAEGAPKKKFFTLKKLLLFLALAAALAASGAVVYKLYFAGQNGSDKPVYVEQELDHVALPQEVLEFAFTRFPGLYTSLVRFNSEILRIDREIGRIDRLKEKYPDQERIVAKEKRRWTRARQGAVKEFTKIQDAVKDLYVLFQVNRSEGRAKIDEEIEELEADASEALEPLADLTQRLKREKPAPKGFFKGTLFKLKKKFF
ncbi:MAG: hypothetical protein R6V54_13855 [Desulfobacteraceae bacterium]